MANKKTFIAILGAFLIICACFSGCLDSPVSPFGEIRGKIISDNGLPERPLGVCTGHYPYIFSDRSGNFSFDYALRPYDVVFGYMDFYYDVNPVKYLSLTRSNTILYDYQLQYENSASIHFTVLFPGSDSNRTIIFKFISSDPFIQNNYYYIGFPSDTNWASSIYIPSDKYSISGKILYLEVSKDYNEIISCNRWGVKDVTFSNLEENEVRFTNDDLHVPSTANVNFNIVPYSNYAGTTESYLSFSGMNHNSEIPLAREYTISGTFQMPVLPGLNCKMRVSNYSSAESWVTASAGENATITQKGPVTLLWPEEGQMGVTDTTSIIIQDDGEKGIYCISFRSGGRLSFLVTDKKQLKIGDVKSYFFEFDPGRRYFWNVTKYGNCNSIDDFVTSPFFESPEYSSKTTTKYSTFIMTR